MSSVTDKVVLGPALMGREALNRSASVPAESSGRPPVLTERTFTEVAKWRINDGVFVWWWGDCLSCPVWGVAEYWGDTV